MPFLDRCTKQFLEWVKTNIHFPHKALEVTLLNYLHEVEHVAHRITYLGAAIDEAVQEAPVELRAVVEALQALRGEVGVAVSLRQSATVDGL